MATGLVVIEQARARHAAFDATTIPVSVALPLLNGVVSRLRGRILDLDPLHFVEQATQTLPLAEFAEGTLLPPFSHLHEAYAITTPTTSADQRGEPVSIIPASQRFDSTVWPACFVVRDRVFLKGTPQEWAPYQSVVFTYVPSFAAMAQPAEEVPLPPQAEMACVEGLAAAFARRRSDSVAPAIVAALQGEAVVAEEQLLANLSMQRTVERWAMREY